MMSSILLLFTLLQLESFLWAQFSRWLVKTSLGEDLRRSFATPNPFELINKISLNQNIISIIVLEKKDNPLIQARHGESLMP